MKRCGVGKHGAHLERFCEEVQRIYILVMHGNKKLPANDEIHFLLGALMQRAQGGEMEHEIKAVCKTFHFGFRGGGGHLASECVVQAEFAHETVYFLRRGSYGVHPR